ncbi:MAG: sensor histidine kinase [Ignavibacteria bacterium]
MKPDNKNKIKSSALFITIAYLIFGILWIAVSGQAVLLITKGSDQIPMLELYKGFFFIIITSLLLYLAISRREKQREKLEAEIAASNKISEEKITETNKSLHALAAHLQTIREEERTLISREIHDQLGQELTALKMDIAYLSRKIEKAKTEPDWDEINSGLRSMSEITDQTINSVRRIARELRPDILDKLGLKEAIEWHAEEFTNRTGIDCIVSTGLSEFDFNRDLDTTIFRIVQESLTNVARHSGATRSKIGLKLAEKFIYLSIEDNGRGITKEEMENTKSLGLVGIKERAFSVGGKISINGSKDKGTILNITIPI